MWRIHLRFTELMICRFGECRGCKWSDREPQSPAASAMPDLRGLKADAMALVSMRQIVQEHDPGVMSISRSTDEQVVARIECMLESGCLRICRDAAEGDADPSPKEIQPSSHNGVLRDIFALHAAGDLRLRGRSFRIIASGEWRRYRETGVYEIVPHAQARVALASMSTDPRRPEGERRTLDAALELLPEEGRNALDGEIVVLRALQARPIVASQGDAITPSAFGRAVAKKENVHWIEIEMVDEAGVGISGQEYLIVAPDRRRFNGVTDGSGRARLDDIVAGQCSVTFKAMVDG